jgi:hypothetical protein
MPRLPPGPYFRTRRAHPSEKNASRVISGFSPLAHPTLAWPPPVEGRALHARRQRLRLTGAYFLLATGPSFAHDNHVMPRPPSGLASRTRRARPSEKNAARVIPGFSPLGHASWACLPPEGRAPHARMGMLWLHPGYAPARPPGVGLPLTIMPYPAFASGLATRARRPRPSEETTSALSPALPPQGHASYASPPAEGRAPHARNDGTTPTPTLPPIGHLVIVNSCCANEMPRHTYGLPTRTRRAHPSEKTTPGLSPAFSRQGHPTLASPPAEGRAPHARDDGTTPTQVLSSLGHRPLARPSVIMTCLALRPARIRGRKDRAPRRKPAPSALSGLTAQGRLHGLASGPVFRTGGAHPSNKSPNTLKGRIPPQEIATRPVHRRVHDPRGRLDPLPRAQKKGAFRGPLPFGL